MEAGAEAEEDNNRGGGICDYGVDDLFNYCDSQNSTPDMGPLQYPRHFKGE